jgi:hypothetical protein
MTSTPTLEGAPAVSQTYIEPTVIPVTAGLTVWQCPEGLVLDITGPVVLDVAAAARLRRALDAAVA